MAKTKETRVALKGENPKKAPKMSETARKVPAHTEEVKSVSDSEASDSDSSSGHSSGSESDAEKRKNTKKPKLSKVKVTEPSSPPVADDTSDNDTSASDDESDSDDKKAPATVDTNGTAVKPVGSSDESSEESESESDAESEEQEKAAEKPRQAGQAAALDTTAAAVIPPQPFVAPSGYKPVKTKSQNASTLSSLFDPKTLSSKQIWHITAPSSVPLSDIKSISLSAIQSHQTVLSHQGTDYNFAEEASTNARVLVPSSKADGYAAVQVPLAKTLHLQQVVRLPKVSSRQTDPDTGSNAAAKVNMPPVRGPRPQPKGLKMRYKPPGFGEGDAGTIGSSDSEAESDVDMADVPATGFRQPTISAKSKRKRDEKEAAETSPRMDKKRRKAKEHEDALAKEAKKAEDRLVEGTKAEIAETAEEKERKKKEKKEKKKKDKSK